jgi:hypothetical protein
MECAIPTGKKFAPPVARDVGGELKVPAVVRHTGDDEAEAGPGIEPLVDEVQFTCAVAYQYGCERGAEAAASCIERERLRNAHGNVAHRCPVWRRTGRWTASGWAGGTPARSRCDHHPRLYACLQRRLGPEQTARQGKSPVT